MVETEHGSSKDAGAIDKRPPPDNRDSFEPQHVSFVPMASMSAGLPSDEL